MNRNLHAAGIMVSWVVAAIALVWQEWWLLAAAPPAGYALSWLGHWWEGSRPATLSAPLRSLACDYRLTWNVLTRRDRNAATTGAQNT